MSTIGLNIAGDETNAPVCPKSRFDLLVRWPRATFSIHGDDAPALVVRTLRTTA